VRVQWNEVKGRAALDGELALLKTTLDRRRVSPRWAQLISACQPGSCNRPPTGLRKSSQTCTPRRSSSRAPKTLQTQHRWSRFEAFVGRTTAARLITSECLTESQGKMKYYLNVTTRGQRGESSVRFRLGATSEAHQ
jgi:hypothetical protein